jgi:isochorismate hydrolase
MTSLSIEPAEVGILLIDVQTLFWQFMHGSQEPVMARLEHLLMLADWLKTPLITTFEHPVEELGTLPERLEQVFPAHGQRHIKRTYNCCGEPDIRTAIRELGVHQFVVAGAETDVCILQSVMGLLGLGYQVFLLEDCLFTTEPHPRPALERMYRSGVIPCTFKTFAYEMTRSVENTPWLETIRRDLPLFPKGFCIPELLPPWDPAH